MAAYYFGESPLEVTAVSSRQDYDVDVVGAALLAFPGDRVAHVGYGFGYDYRNDVRIWGSTGQLVIDRSFSIPPDREPSVTLIRNTAAERLALPAADQFQLQLEHFLRLVESGAGPELDKIIAHAAAMEAARMSAVEGRTVAIAEVRA
jgi:NDP-hexose-3-ketoreductase